RGASRSRRRAAGPRALRARCDARIPQYALPARARARGHPRPDASCGIRAARDDRLRSRAALFLKGPPLVLGLVLLWSAVAILGYQYVGYPLLLAALAGLRGRFTSRRSADASELPSVSLLISAYDEEEVIARKIENAL